MSRKFWLKNITLHKSPGFAAGTFPKVEKLGQHLNVLWGPNGVGKSTLTRAMRALIWDTKNTRDVEADGLLQAPDTDWSLSLSQDKLIQTRLQDNLEVPLPGRNDELSESYWFTLHELLQEDGRSTDTFLKQVRTSMQGGVDLDSACEKAGGIPSFSSGNIAQAKQARQASEELQKIIAIQEEHKDIQEKLTNLQQEVDQARELSVRKALLEDAEALLHLSDKIQEQEQKLFLYPPSIEHIDKSSPKRLEELLDAHAQANREEISCIQSRDRLQREFLQCSIGEQQLEDLEKPNRVANTYEGYKEALDHQTTAAKEFSSAHMKLLEWEREHAWLGGEMVEDKTLEAYVGTLKTLAQECEPLRCDVAAKKRLLEGLGEYEEVGYPEQDLSLLQMRLSDWLVSFWKLQGTPKNKALNPGTKSLLLLLMVIIGGATSWLGFAVQPAFFMMGFVLIFFVVVLLLPSSANNKEYEQVEKAFLLAKQEGERILKQLAWEEEYPETLESCQKLMEKLRYELTHTRMIESQNRRRKLANDQVQAAIDRLQKWTAAWQDAAKALGLKGDEERLEGSQFFHFAERLQTWSTYRLAFVETQEALSIAQEEAGRTLSLLQRELGVELTEISDLKAKSESLVERFGKALSLQSAMRENATRLLAAQSQLQASKDAIKDFWEKAGLEFGNETELLELVTKLDEWNDLKVSLKYNRSLYEGMSEKNPKALEFSRTYAASDLSEALGAVVEEQSMLEQKREELGGLRVTFEALKSSSALSTAQRKEASALAELEAYRNEQVMARMISSLASDLKHESEKQFQPQVLAYASGWLSGITNHRYTLSANNEGFFATDTIMAKNYKLDELSSGTRIQLLFSIRMAFITMQEETSGVRLPIFLDELLANSDDDRALAIAQAIGAIADERQVFYVTAQRDEVEKLKTIVTSEVTVIPLEDLQKGYRVSKEPLRPYIHEWKGVPSPLEDYQEYGKALLVAGPSLWESIEGLHSWHLLDDSAVLFGYLQQGLEHIGQLTSAKAKVNPLLAFRFQLLKAAQQKAQMGRSKLMHLFDLNDPALALNRDAKFWTQIQEVVGPEGCTGKELLEAVEDKRIQRFGDANLELLSNWLFDKGFATDSKSESSQAILEDLFVEFEALTVGSTEEVIVRRWLKAVIG